jgi:hypothetical protein
MLCKVKKICYQLQGTFHTGHHAGYGSLCIEADRIYPALQSFAKRLEIEADRS